VQPIIIQANFRDVPPEFPSAPPEEWKVIPPNLSPDEYKLNVRQKMHREEWENSLGMFVELLGRMMFTFDRRGVRYFDVSRIRFFSFFFLFSFFLTFFFLRSFFQVIRLSV
jgi:hypothetical protein